MNFVTIPNSKRDTTSLGLGCSYLTGGFEKRASLRLVHAAWSAGFRHFDVAPSYGLGMAEGIVGEALVDRRHHCTIASKVGIPRPLPAPHVFLIRAILNPVRHIVPTFVRSFGARKMAPKQQSKEFGSRFIEASLAASLRLLQTDYLDILFLHEVSIDEITPELLRCLEDLRANGQVRALGVASDYATSKQIARLHGSFFDVFQYTWSVLDHSQKLLSSTFSITHRAIMRAFVPLRTWTNGNREACHRLSDAIGADLSSPAVLADVILASALSANPDGIVLAASRRIQRVCRFAEVASNTGLIEVGRRLRSAIGDDPATFPGAAQSLSQVR